MLGVETTPCSRVRLTRPSSEDEGPTSITSVLAGSASTADWKYTGLHTLLTRYSASKVEYAWPAATSTLVVIQRGSIFVGDTTSTNCARRNFSKRRVCLAW